MIVDLPQPDGALTMMILPSMICVYGVGKYGFLCPGRCTGSEHIEYLFLYLLKLVFHAHYDFL